MAWKSRPPNYRPRYTAPSTPASNGGFKEKILLAMLLVAIISSVFFYYKASKAEGENIKLSSQMSAVRNMSFKCPEFECNEQLLAAELGRAYEGNRKCIEQLRNASEERNLVLRENILLQQQCWGSDTSDPRFLAWDCQAKLDLCLLKCGED